MRRSHWSVLARRLRRRPAPITDTYYDAIAGRESGEPTASCTLASPARYAVVNQLDYLGKYQMGNAALIEAGLYSGAVSVDVQLWDDTQWTAAARALGVTSRAGFLASASAQEYAIRAYTDAQWNQLVAMGLDSYAGQVVYGEKVTAEGLLAGAHLMGAHSVEAYLRYGNDITDPNGTPVSSYIGLFPLMTPGAPERHRLLIRELTRQCLRRVVETLSCLARPRAQHGER